MYFLDYTGPAGFPEAVAEAIPLGTVIVLDHHKTAQESLVGRSDLPPNLSVNIDMDRSGATIARDWFASAIPEARPPLTPATPDARLAPCPVTAGALSTLLLPARAPRSVHRAACSCRGPHSSRGSVCGACTCAVPAV